MFKEWYQVIRKIKTPDEVRRAKICSGCEHRAHANFLQFAKGDIKEVQGFYCNLCKCPLVAKIKTTDENHICEKWR